MPRDEPHLFFTIHDSSTKTRDDPEGEVIFGGDWKEVLKAYAAYIREGRAVGISGQGRGASAWITAHLDELDELARNAIAERERNEAREPITQEVISFIFYLH
jgi:hypothetical protein